MVGKNSDEIVSEPCLACCGCFTVLEQSIAMSFLSALRTPMDAGSFERSVIPCFSLAFRHVSENHSLRDATVNPFVSGSFLSILISLFAFTASSVTGNWSWYSLRMVIVSTDGRVDRMWSILPAVYSIHYCVFAAMH